MSVFVCVYSRDQTYSTLHYSDYITNTPDPVLSAADIRY